MEELKKCTICKESLSKNSINFSKNSASKDLLSFACKPCDNKRRTERFKSKASHNIHRRCKICDKFFYAEFCKIKRGWYKFCSTSCRVKAKGLMSWGGKRRGENNPKAKLSEKDVIKIISRLRTESVKGIAKDYAVSIACIRFIATNRTWKHIER